ncbi:M20 family metallo-hydrolase [Inediibacterium massiliense]|uniref:M20 family metallo-hydrolase n=1 Tax=Inediibacterium massiliense TaxID=1658111 RepID=UPI0018FE413E|nr:M20 family metallo-hydrolase [Inediibacterium massiliense]
MKSSFIRIKRDIEKLSEFSETQIGCTRFPYTKEDKSARNYLIEEMKKIGLSVRIDGIGNIHGVLEGTKDLPKVMMGSHIDTVFEGGNFDGVGGVICGLEVMRVLKEEKIILDHPVELVVFVGEEGCDFDSPYIGSKVLTGKFHIEDLKKIRNKKGISAYNAAKDFGLDPDTIHKDVLVSKDIKAMVELHIEQSLVLDHENISIGIVENIAGLSRLEVIVKGVANHSGATPMYLRQDALLACARMITKVNEITIEKGNCSTVATVGRILCSPNQVNAIGGEVSFTIDIRDIDKKMIQTITEEVIKNIKEIAVNEHVEIQIYNIGTGDPMELSSNIIDMIEEVVKSKNIKSKRMNSGAGHDACMFEDITDVGMIFVPSVGGRSHVPEEFTKYEDLQLGCEVLLDTIIKLALDFYSK